MLQAKKLFKVLEIIGTVNAPELHRFVVAGPEHYNAKDFHLKAVACILQSLERPAKRNVLITVGSMNA